MTADEARLRGGRPVAIVTTNSSGNGTCQSQFLGLQRLAIAQLRLGGVSGTPGRN